MKHLKFSVVSVVIFLIFSSCSEEDPSPAPDSEEENESLTPVEVVNILTDDSQSMEDDFRVWTVASAELNNSSGTFTISSLANVQDDEFLFTQGSSDSEVVMVWRPRDVVDITATSIEEAKFDLYASPEEFTGTIDPDNPQILEFGDGMIRVEIIDDDEIIIQTGNLESVSGISSKPRGKFHFWSDWCSSCYLSFYSTPKTEADYSTTPSSLSFSTVVDLAAEDISNIVYGSPGFTGSLASNKLYWSYHGADGNEHVFSYDLTTGEKEDCGSDKNSFVTKQLHVIGNELKLIGGKRINTYPLDLQPTSADPSCNPDSHEHGLMLSRFGSAVMESNIYIFGGDIDEINSDKIYRYNDETNSLIPVGSMPGPKSWANGDIVDGKLYVFGGQQQFSGTSPEDTIFIYNFETGDTETLHLPQALFRSYAARKENYIYVAGQLESNKGIFFGRFNTIDNSFEEIEVSLDGSGNKTIHQMAIIDNKIYVIYGGLDGEGNSLGFSIESADL